MKIIGIAGLGRAGKTTAAQAIGAKAFTMGDTPIIEQFASPLKAAARTMGFSKAENPEAYRWFCQTVGEHARQLDVDWFVKLFQQRVASHAALEGTQSTSVWRERIILVDDMRYENEIEAVRQLQGKTIFVSAYKRIDDHNEPWRKHHSENLAYAYESGELSEDLFDIQVSNNEHGIAAQATFETIIAQVGWDLVTRAQEEIT